MLRLPALRGTIERRILVNFNADPDPVARMLPAPFRPKLVDGRAVVGICLIRLGRMRPLGLPACLPISAENAAHRIAVEWDEDGATRQGVYVPRRDTSSGLVALLSDRVVAGRLHRARFSIVDQADRLRVDMLSCDGETRVRFDGEPQGDLAQTSVFRSLDEASAFFEQGSVAYSPTATPGAFTSIELRAYTWAVEPLQVREVRSSFFEDESHFPSGSITFDNALLMRRIEHELHSAPDRIWTPSGEVRRSA